MEPRPVPAKLPPYMDELRALGVVGHLPRVHPNGFIQLDLDERRRLHVYHPALEVHQKTYHPIHDHIFSFVSMIYSGRLINVAYDAVSDKLRGTHVVWQARSIGGEESVLERREDLIWRRLVPRVLQVFQPGEGYEFPAKLLHEVAFTVPTMTIIHKSAKTAAQGNKLVPVIMVPVGVEPDNDFRREDHDVEDLWRLIAEAHPHA